MRLIFLLLTFFSLPINVEGQSFWNKLNNQIVKKRYHKKIEKIHKKLIQQNHAVEPKNETPDGYWEQEFIATMNPKLGRPTPEALIPFATNTKQNNSVNKRAVPGSQYLKWVERGPNNIGGRTRALEWDPTTINSKNKKVWAGSVSGGLWYNENIASSTSEWQSVSSLWPNLTVTCIAFDPMDPKIMYVGTGEGLNLSNNSSTRGYGIFKTTDGGNSWVHLPSTEDFEFIHDIAVRKELVSPKLNTYRSVVYVGRDVHTSGHVINGDSSTAGLYRSINGGTSFTKMDINVSGRGYSGSPDRIEIDDNNDLWVSTKTNELRRIYDGGGGRIYYSSDGINYSLKYKNSNGRSPHCVVACAPNGKDTLYALIADRTGVIQSIIRSFDHGDNWDTLTLPVDADTNITNEFTRGQAWYDLAIGINPKNSKEVIIGGINLFRTKNGGTSWNQISKWSENAYMNQLSCSYVHADHHEIQYHPNENIVILGNDGGVFYIPNHILNLAASDKVIVDRNNNYLVTQFYCGDMSMKKGSNYMLAGSQDNGTPYLNQAGIADRNMRSGGDGGYCMISEVDDDLQITSTTRNRYFVTTDFWKSWEQIVNEKNTGSFINPADLDYVNDYLYTAKGSGTIYRFDVNQGSSSKTEISFSNKSNGVPSTIYCYKRNSNNKNRLLIGTEGGDVLMCDPSLIGTYSFNKISSGINTGHISSIYSHNKSDDTLFVTLSNYGVKNIYMTTNGGMTWKVLDGNLPDIPVWDIIINSKDNKSALIATEVGIYSCSNIFGKAVIWVPAMNGMGNVKVRSLKYRVSDQTIMAASHGRGVFTSNAWGKRVFPADFDLKDTLFCVNEKIQLSSKNSDADSVKWVVIPKNNNYSIVNNTSLNTTISFNAPGSYILSLLSYGDTIDNGNNYTKKSIIVKVVRTEVLSSGKLELVVDKDPIVRQIDTNSHIEFSVKNSNADSFSWYRQEFDDPKPKFLSSGISKNYALKESLKNGTKIWPVLHSNFKCINKAKLDFEFPVTFSFPEITGIIDYYCQNDTSKWSTIDSFSTNRRWELYNSKNERINISKSKVYDYLFKDTQTYKLVLNSFMDTFYSENKITVSVKPDLKLDISDIIITRKNNTISNYCWNQDIELNIKSSIADSIQWYIDDYNEKYKPLEKENTKTLLIKAPIPSGKSIIAQVFSNYPCTSNNSLKSNSVKLLGNGIAPILKRNYDSLIVSNPTGSKINWFLDNKLINTTAENYIVASQKGIYYCVFIGTDTCNSPESNEINVENLKKIGFDRFGSANPNPVKDEFTWNSKFTGMLMLYNSTGKLINSFNVQAGEPILITLSQYSSGVYYISGIDKNQTLLFQNYKVLLLD